MFIEGTCESCFSGFFSALLVVDEKAVYHALCLEALVGLLACGKPYVYTYIRTQQRPIANV